MNDGSLLQTGEAYVSSESTRAPSSLTVRLARLQRTRAYDIAVRMLGSAWFLLLAAVIAQGTISELNRAGALASYADWAVLLSRSCQIAFYLILWWLIVTRPPAVARSDGFMPSLAAFAGTYMPWSISLVGQGEHSVVLNLLSAVCLIAGMLLAVFTVLHLGRSFSLIPQARRVVQVGPYRWIRHPLYLSEEIAVLGTVLQVFSIGALVMLLAHIAVQIRRILYEEKLLRQALPEYRADEASRWRLLPGIW